MKHIDLRQVATINPRRPRKDDIKDLAAPVSFVDMASVSEENCQIESEETRPIGEVRSGYTFFEPGDILLAKITPCFENGKIAIANIQHEYGFGSTEFHVIRPNPDQLDRRYLFHFLRQPTLRADAESKMTGSAGQKRVPTSYLNTLRISLPPLPEQRRIAAVLDKADALRRKRQQALAKLDTLLESVFLDMFGDPVTNPKGWTKVSFASCLTPLGLRNGLSPSSKGIYPAHVLTLSAITGDEYNPHEVKEALFDKELPADKLVNADDFLICRGNGNLSLVGRGFFPNQSMPSTLFPDTMIAGRVDQQIVAPKFLEALWRTNSVRDQIEKKARTTNGTHKINQQILESIEIILPDRRYQSKFTKAATAVEKIKSTPQLSHIQDLFNALMQRAFNGELELREVSSDTDGDGAAASAQMSLF